MLIYNNLVMKKFRLIVFSLFLGAFLTACAFGVRDDGNDNITINRDGTLIYRIRESFSESYYNAEELKNMIISEAAAYNSQNVSGAVLANKIEVLNGKTDIELKFATVDDYSRFDDILMFCGTIEDAIARGESLAVILNDVNDKNLSISEKDIQGMTSEKILITDFGETIYLPAKAYYISDNAILSEDMKTVHLDPAAGGTMYIIYK